MSNDDLPEDGTSRIHRIDVDGDAYIAEVMHVHLPPPAPPMTPRQLPPDVSDFTGRNEQLIRLDNLYAEAGDGASAVVISAVSGTAGVGKTDCRIVTHLIRDVFTSNRLVWGYCRTWQ